MRTFVYAGVVFILWIGMAMGAQAQFSELDPHEAWKVLDTEHVRVIYHAGL